MIRITELCLAASWAVVHVPRGCPGAEVLCNGHVPKSYAAAVDGLCLLLKRYGDAEPAKAKRVKEALSRVARIAPRVNFSLLALRPASGAGVQRAQAACVRRGSPPAWRAAPERIPTVKEGRGGA